MLAAVVRGYNSPAPFYCNGSLILWTVFILARLQMCSGGLFLYWPVSRFAKSRKDGYARRLGAGGGCGASARSWLMVGELPSTLVCADKSKSNREAAKACMAAWLSIALQREIKALVMERWRMAGACLALDCAKSRMKVAASWLHRPPTSMPKTTSLQRRDVTNSG